MTQHLGSKSSAGAAWVALAACAALIAAGCSSGSDDTLPDSGASDEPAIQQTDDSAGSTETGSDGSAGPDGADSFEFCDVLSESIQTMQSNSQGASDDVVGQLDLLARNLSESNRMLESLADVAPDEIAVDMEIVVDAWRTQLDAVPNATDSPLSVIATVVSSAFLSNASFGAVDVWSQSKCGVSVFSGSQTTVLPCPGVPANTVELLRRVAEDSEVPASDLSRLLGIGVEHLPDVSGAVAALNTTIEALDPPARTAREAVGRAAYVDPMSLSALESLKAELQEWCANSIPVDVSAFTRPTLNDRTWSSAVSPWGECRHQTVLAGPVVVVECSEWFSAIDLTSGAVVHADKSPEREYQANGGPLFVDLEFVTEAASGLDPTEYVSVVHVIDVRSGEETSFEVRRSENDNVPFGAEPLGNDYVRLRVNNFNHSIWRLDGSQVDLSPVWGDENGWVRELGLRNLVMMGQNFGIELYVYDIVSGAVQVIDESSLGGNETYDIIECPGIQNYGRFSLRFDSDPIEVDRTSEWALPAGGGVRATLASSSFGGDRLEGVTPAGDVRWSISLDTVLDDFVVLGSWVPARNEGGEFLMINAYTGEVAEVPPTLQRIGELQLDGMGDLRFVESENVLYFVNYTDNAVVRVERDELCS